ncbi:ANTAR domain-containing protein [Paraburkholderia sp. SIMBA_009]|uniref:Two-component response regulator, AmiR/NasT family, consists of REC and RNA-binding antiterminator (ANTAR) domains n=1 Tax=Paraburkholderia tropica TaxID=92647 RepID=A0AAQ1GN34_9BURK|nr:ANTAR domain-containing protein [Paraburkholderia tropica]QNB17375.1 ANTAR domain-containing protein [Paraburkholderia tropica]RQN36219.1 ANTAR domain-containing protein [Paraburkholderia tropica]SEK14101.1 Two-component response regulator, AmiR/NasT family, consists of REC and RNA-binding antiterminator (ANTAR) domains [Paraburkholderia tropica]
MKPFHTARTPEILRAIRSLHVAVIHPDDDDRAELVAQLNLIGCRVCTFWPHAAELPDSVDLVFLAVRPESLAVELKWRERRDPLPVIPVVTYENPIIIEAAMQLDAHCVISSPVRSFGVLTAISITMFQHRNRLQLERRVKRNDEKASERRQIQRATAILSQSNGISEDKAYELLRAKSMTDRTPIEQIASAIINANQLLRM